MEVKAGFFVVVLVCLRYELLRKYFNVDAED